MHMVASPTATARDGHYNILPSVPRRLPRVYHGRRPARLSWHVVENSICCLITVALTAKIALAISNWEATRGEAVRQSIDEAHGTGYKLPAVKVLLAPEDTAGQKRAGGQGKANGNMYCGIL